MPVDEPTRTTGRWHWLWWAAAVAVSVALAWVAVEVVAFLNGPSCDATATTSNRNGGLIDLAIATAVISAPWLGVGLNLGTYRLRLVVGWALGVSLLVGFGLTHLTVASWGSIRGGFCF